MRRLVLDANIYVKLFKKEADTEQVRDLIATILRDKRKILAPSIVINETVRTLEVHNIDISQACRFFNALIESSLEIVEVSSDLINATLDITKQGHQKSGYPTFSDSMYQAIAIQRQALFITADKRHYEKTKHLGNIDLLNSSKL
jgi:predicted nucleic acid-binding protein